MKKKIIASFIVTALTLSQVSAFAMHEPTHLENEETKQHMRLYGDTENEIEDTENYSKDVESDFENNAELFATSGNYAYTVNSYNTVKITDYNGTDTEITIPSEIDGRKVTSIGEYAFSGCESLERITIPESVTSIEYSAFSYCSSLKRITIPDSVTSIGGYAFWGTALYNNEENWENGVLYIGKHLIEAKDDISGEYEIKDGTVTIADSAFFGCSSVKSYEVSENNQNYTSVDGVFFNKEKTELMYYPAKSDVTEYMIPDSVTNIGDYAFGWCSSLASITIPDSVTSIGDGVFCDCKRLTDITIPDSVTNIGVRAFEYCSSLESITIPDSVTSIGSDAFSRTALYNNEENWEDGVLYIGKHLIEAKDDISGEYEIKDGTLTIAGGAFLQCSSLESITIPDGVTSIGDSAFYLCSSLTSITIPNSVTSIVGGAFSLCNNLTIYGYENSYAQEYAKNNYIPFSVILEFNDVILDKPEVSYDNGKVNVKVTINTEKNSGFKVYAAVYDDKGNMIGIKEVSVSEKNVTVDAKEKPKKVKVFAFKTADGVSPLCENQEITDI